MGQSAGKEWAYERKNKTTETLDVGNGEERRKNCVAVHRPAFPWIFTFYGLSDLLCSVCKYEQVDGNEFSGG